MQLQIDKLGKVSITIEESYWDINKDYDKLTVVEKEGTFGTYISRKPVPAGSLLTDRTYWIPFSSLKEDIVLDYTAFTAKYGKELIDVKDHISEIDEQLEILNKLNANTNEAIATANKAIDVATTAINAAKDALSEAEKIIDTNEKYTEKLNGIGKPVTINDNVHLGTSTTTEANVFVGENAKIGRNVIAEQNAFVGQNAVVEENVNIGKNVNIMAETNIASKTYITDRGLFVGTKTDDNHIIGRDNSGNIFIGSDANGVNIRFNKDEYYPINISNSAGGTRIKINKNASVLIGSILHADINNTGASVIIGSGVNVDPNIKILDKGNITISTNTVDNAVLGKNCILGSDVKLYKNGNELKYYGDKAYTIATKGDVDKRINDIVAGAPEAYDTLKEISNKLQNNDDVVAGIITTLGGKADKSDLSNITGKTIVVGAQPTDNIEIIKDSKTVYPITKLSNLINGDRTYVLNSDYVVNITGNIKISDSVTIKSFVNIGTKFETHSSRDYEYEGFTIGNTTIGSNVTIGSGTSIAQNIIISTNLDVVNDKYVIGTGPNCVNIGKAVNISNNTHLINGVFIAKTYIGQANIINANIGDSVTINNDVNIGNTVNIDDGSHIYKNSNIGTNVSISEETYIGGVLTVADKGALSITTKDGQAATYIGTNVSIGENIGIGDKVYIQGGVSVQENIKLINILNSSNSSKIQGLRIRNDKSVIEYQLGTGLDVTRRDNDEKVIHIGENFNASTGVQLGSGAALADNAYIGTGIKFTVNNGNLIVTINDTQYGVTLNTLG